MTSRTDSSSDALAGIDIDTLMSHLACPAGETGLAVGDMMERVNAALIDAAFTRLDPQADERIVEIGPGNGGHIESVLTRAPRLTLVGLDISPTMTTAARERNAMLLARGRVALTTADAASIPYENASFDKAIAINSVYFWPDLLAGLREIRRVLRDEGQLVIAAMTPEAALSMPFSRHGFRVYGPTTFREACFEAGFDHVQIERYVDHGAAAPAPAALRTFFLVRASCMQ
ncbi:class I SAM-dependent methyltransferase [Paraburkholderia youngii]|uniref:Ubiquinone/menaquinone biosynthesis C-methylase UbiE n=1 Tax=Paraburkholderia youngii TaxID=2782701 RepID=A0A7W8LCS4_9BURK|nr:class I SAM-dependent methyltransferase [Paraburkholderia youngii]MBB5404647.1 ubiquinone/menaquinone biosynthesis C-methylase UbiE [Paraburkholderia youngii]NUX57786.1 class I SAM-dependent methyltransferase [Paraburkholderia youngii]